MSAQIIDGKAVAKEVEGEVRVEVERLLGMGHQPTLVVVRVGHDPASEVYVKSKARKAEELGLRGVEKHFESDISQAQLEATIMQLNADGQVDGILVQLPLPNHIDAKRILDLIDPSKDVDGFHPVNVGNLHLGRTTLAPCTPAGSIRLIESTRQPIAGAHAVVIGRSDIVGKPAAAMLLARNATVSICHSRTLDLATFTRQADIIVAAVGRPLLLKGDMVKPGAVVIDVGINRLEQSVEAESLLAHDQAKLRILTTKGATLVGDVDFATVKEVAGWVTPVPGGVGPMTIAMLMKNTVTAAAARRQ